MKNQYPPEVLGEYDDDGTMVNNVEALSSAVIGHRIVSAERAERPNRPKWGEQTAFYITLDNGKKVELINHGDCCAYTELTDFWLDPSAVDHIILGVGTTDEYTTWHIYADFGDIMRLKVDWSCGNPFYYAYGFDINVIDGGE